MSLQKPYKYFDTPDGYDVGKKLICLMKPIVTIALPIGLADVILVTRPKGYLAVLGRMAYVSSPIFGASLSFLVVTNGLASIRNKEDKLNWFLGGFSAGSIFGAFARNRMLGFNLGIAFGTIAFLRKYAAECDFVLFPDFKFYHDGPIASDWTLTKYRPGNWTTGAK